MTLLIPFSCTGQSYLSVVLKPESTLAMADVYRYSPGGAYHDHICNASLLSGYSHFLKFVHIALLLDVPSHSNIKIIDMSVIWLYIV